MASWRDYAQTVEPDGPTCANSVVSADSTTPRAVMAPIGPNDTNGTGSLSLPLAVARGVEALPRMSCPRDVASPRWPIAVADALKLARDGWAAKAIALGWHDLELFGAVTDAAGDPFGDGLAVWLNGRKLVAMTATCATVVDGGGQYFYHRREQVGARLLWEIAR